MPDLVIRRALREELDEINRIRRQVCDVHVNGRPDIFRADGWQFIEPMAEVCLKEENANVIAAVLNGEIVGFMTVQYIVKPMGPYSHERRFYRIEEFGVDENHRRQGIATVMIGYAKKDAEE